MQLNPQLLPPAQLFAGLNPHLPGPTSGLTPKDCSSAWDWASQLETKPAPGSSRGQLGAETQTAVGVPAPMHPKTWHRDLRGGCSDTSFPPKKALHPPPPTLCEVTAASGAAPGGVCAPNTLPLGDKMLS